MASDCRFLDRDLGIAALEQTQGLCQGRLRLDGHNTRPEPPERSHSIAYMRTDIENEIARPHELAVEPIHGRAMLPVAVINAQRSDNSS